MCVRVCVCVSGPLILHALSDRLGLGARHTASSWRTLRDFGNMSSATLLFVLQDIVRQRRSESPLSSAAPGPASVAPAVAAASPALVSSPPSSPFVPALAFGPGLNVEGCLLKWVG